VTTPGSGKRNSNARTSFRPSSLIYTMDKFQELVDFHAQLVTESPATSSSVEPSIEIIKAYQLKYNDLISCDDILSAVMASLFKLAHSHITIQPQRSPSVLPDCENPFPLLDLGKDPILHITTFLNSKENGRLQVASRETMKYAREVGYINANTLPHSILSNCMSS